MEGQNCTLCKLEFNRGWSSSLISIWNIDKFFKIFKYLYTATLERWRCTPFDTTHAHCISHLFSRPNPFFSTHPLQLYRMSMITFPHGGFAYAPCSFFIARVKLHSCSMRFNNVIGRGKVKYVCVVSETRRVLHAFDGPRIISLGSSRQLSWRSFTGVTEWHVTTRSRTLACCTSAVLGSASGVTEPFLSTRSSPVLCDAPLGVQYSLK
jgi:hypothetical protein